MSVHGVAASPPALQLELAGLPHELGDASRVQMFTARSGEMEPLTLGSDGSFGDEIADTAYRNALVVDRELRDRFGRNGWDGEGSPLRVVVHQPDVNGGPLNNAYWSAMTQSIHFGDGDGTLFAPLGNALDVVAHEAVHAVVDGSVDLRYSGEPGALHESFADVIAVAVEGRNWTIGEDVFKPDDPTANFRDLANPRYDSVDRIPLDSELGVHELSGIPSLAAYRSAELIGKDAVGKVWFNALTQHLDADSDFAGAAQATIQAASDLYGADSSNVQAIHDAWLSVGVTPAGSQTPSGIGQAASGASQLSLPVT